MKFQKSTWISWWEEESIYNSLLVEGVFREVIGDTSHIVYDRRDQDN